MSAARGGGADVVIRPYRDADFDQLFANIEVVAAEGRWIATEAPVNRDRWRASIAEEISGGGIHLVAEVAGRVVGSAGLRRIVPGLFELGMSLHPEWRRHGIGSALMRQLIRWARDHRAYKLTLQVWPHNEAAIALYERFGFRREGHLRRHWRRRNGELWDAYVMGLVIDGSANHSSTPDDSD